MGKYIAITLVILLVFFAGLFGYMYFQGASSATPKIKNAQVEIENKDNLRLLLSDLGWYKANTLTMLSGITIQSSEVTGIEVVYSNFKQPFLQQGDGKGNVFASVDTEVVNDKLVFTVHVDPKRLTEARDRNWWIDSQVIRALHKMLNPNTTDEMLIEKDRQMFDKYKGKIDLWHIKF